MSLSGVVVEESIDLSHRLPREVADALIAIVGAAGYDVITIDDLRYQLSRRVRPGWAGVLGWATVPLLVGVALLAVRATERCEAVVSGAPTTRLRLSGRLPVELRDRLRALAATPAPPLAPQPVPGARAWQTPPAWQASGSGPAAVSTPAAAPAPAPVSAPAPVGWEAPPPSHQAPATSVIQPLGPGELIDGVPGRTGDDSTVRRSSEVDSAAAVDGGDAPPVPVELLMQPAGRALRLARLSLIGREPRPGPGEQPDQLVTVQDSAVSKTHLAFGLDATGAWVCDRNSTNGTAIVDSHGEIRRCPAGTRVPLRPGDTVALGSLRLTAVYR